MKFKILVSSFLILSVFIACSDNTEEKNKEDVISSTDIPEIEVVQNENMMAIKVQEKQNDKNQSKSYYLDYNVKSAYSQYAQPANKDASVRVKPRTNIDANMHIRNPYEKVDVSLLVRKMSKNFIVKCSACHNDYANGMVGPSLLGKDIDYLFNKIADFKSGKKSNPLMNDLIKMMSDDEIKEVAIEIYDFNKEIELRRNK